MLERSQNQLKNCWVWSSFLQPEKRTCSVVIESMPCEFSIFQGAQTQSTMCVAGLFLESQSFSGQAQCWRPWGKGWNITPWACESRSFWTGSSHGVLSIGGGGQGTRPCEACLGPGLTTLSQSESSVGGEEGNRLGENAYRRPWSNWWAKVSVPRVGLNLKRHLCTGLLSLKGQNHCGSPGTMPRKCVTWHGTSFYCHAWREDLGPEYV